MASRPPKTPVVHLRGEDHYWRVIRRLDARGRWTIPQVADESNGHYNTVGAYVTRLVRAGIARVVATGRKHNRDLPTMYQLAAAPTATPRIRADGTLIGATQQECMWNAMRAHRGGFTTRDIAFAASVPEQPVKEVAARRYIELLAGAGYLVLLKRRLAPSDANVWKLKPTMNTGPLSPTVVRCTGIYDRNLGQIVGTLDAEMVLS